MKKGFIVCVDDQLAVLDTLMVQLEHAVGHLCEIEIAESAEEALKVIRELDARGERIDMVISDEVMPGMQGAQFLEIIHQNYPEVIKVMLTGQAGLESVAYAINHAGLDKYFTKPWEFKDLHLSISSLLEKARLARNNKQLTMELQEKYRELEATYHELAAAYKQLKNTQEQLIHAERLAIVGQVSSGIAHEVKNQLNMMGFAELIQEAYPDDVHIQEYTEFILSAGRNIYNLIDEMRRFAKKESRQYTMRVHSVTDVLEDLLNFIRFDKSVAHRKLITQFDGNPQVQMNSEKIGQVLINLVRNAAQATAEESGEITISVSSNGDAARITVQDNGCGIPDDLLSKIWEPFFTTKGDEGTGLGLDICKRIIEEHQGQITCASQVNVGTTFTVSLPMLGVIEKQAA